MNLDRINHVAVPVQNIEQGIKWYKKNFSCEVSYADDTWALLNFDNIGLALVLPEQHPGHFAVERDDALDYGLLSLHRDKTQSVYIKDPWDNDVEILQIEKNG